MKIEEQISGLAQLGGFLQNFLAKKEIDFDDEELRFQKVLIRSGIENQWFTKENLNFCLKNWAEILTPKNIEGWLEKYPHFYGGKKIGLVLAGNIPLAGFHDVVCTVLSQNIPLIKMSSKDKILLPFLMEKWKEFSVQNIDYQFVEKLKDYDAVIATGSNNTARYLEYYFGNAPHIIRKNRTAAAVLDGNETPADLRLLARDIFTYFGLGCRNVTKLFLPENYEIGNLFENFLEYSQIINHHGYANNYDYNRAIYLLNREKFWDNHFVLLKEDKNLFSPLAVVHFSRYKNLNEVKNELKLHKNEIQCVVAKPTLIPDSVDFGEAQRPNIDVYADNADTMMFLGVI